LVSLKIANGNLSFRFLRNHNKVSATKMSSLSTQLLALKEKITRILFWFNSTELLNINYYLVFRQD